MAVLTQVQDQPWNRNQEEFRKEQDALHHIPREAIERIARVAGIKLPPGNSPEYWKVARLACAAVAVYSDESGQPRTMHDGAILLGGHNSRSTVN